MHPSERKQKMTTQNIYVLTQKFIVKKKHWKHLTSRQKES